MAPAQIAEAQRMAREWKHLGAPGKSCSDCALDERRPQGKGLLLGLRNPLALLMKLGVALARTCGAGASPNGPDTAGPYFSEVWAVPLLAASFCGCWG
jgi:hypothetical protein